MPKETIMSKTRRIRTEGAYVIKSAESRPRAIEAAKAGDGRSWSVVTGRDKKLAQAVRAKRQAAA
jgi:hypothetical protein